MLKDAVHKWLDAQPKLFYSESIQKACACLTKNSKAGKYPNAAHSRDGFYVPLLTRKTCIMSDIGMKLQQISPAKAALEL
jgi:hypothetical protein